MEGYPYTWWHRRGYVDEVEELLDRSLASSTCNSLFPHAKLSNLVATMSDHSPILLSYREKVYLPTSHKFRFENAWLIRGWFG